MNKKNDLFITFFDTIKTLRAQGGCPWDQKQTSYSLKKYIREETEELLEAIDGNDAAHICEEAGDLLFLIALLSEIHKENNEFTMEDILSTVTQKMIRRHPHVFGDAKPCNEEELKAQWEKIKSEERSKKIN
jgi:MazG family protein